MMESKPSDLALGNMVTSKYKGFEVLVFLQKTKTSNGLQKVLKLVLRYLLHSHAGALIVIHNFLSSWFYRY